MSFPVLKVTVKASGTLLAPIFQVWTYIRAFGRAEVWNGYYQGAKIVTALLPGQIDGQIGAVRTTAIGAASYVEQLEALDVEEFTLKYRIVDHPQNTNPFPGSLFNFKSSIKLLEVTRSNETYMEWTGHFDTYPQEVDVMQQAVEDLFEAGFVGLEILLTPAPAFPSVEPPLRQHPMVHGQNLSELSRNLGSMSIRSGGAGPSAMGLDPTAPTNAFQHQRSYMGPASVVSDLPPPPHLQESTSVSSHESSPHLVDRAPGGFHHQWTSGGSGQMLSHFPKRLSAEQELANRRNLNRHRSSKKETPPGIDPTSFFGRPIQGSRHSASSIESLPGYHEPSRPEPLRKDLSMGTAVSEHMASDLEAPEPQAYDPVLQDREEFKRSLLKNNLTTISSLQTKNPNHLQRNSAASDKLRGTLERTHEQSTPDNTPPYSVNTSNLPSPQNPDDVDNLEWARSKQQKEMEAREAFSRKAGRMGVFNQAAAPGGPFAAASNAFRPPVLQRYASQQSMDSLGEALPTNYSSESRRPGLHPS